MKITESQVRKFSFRNGDCSGWADIVIDVVKPARKPLEREPFTIFVTSDYGHWTYHWTHPGPSWKRFLASISIDYAADKFGAGSWFDEQKAERRYLHDIIHARRSGDLPKDIARDAWDAVKTVFSDCSGAQLIAERLLNSDWIKAWDDYYDMLHDARSIEPAFRTFWQEVWPHFIGHITKDAPKMRHTG